MSPDKRKGRALGAAFCLICAEAYCGGAAGAICGATEVLGAGATVPSA